MIIEDLREFANTDKIKFECSSCNCSYERKVRDIKTSIKNNKFRLVCLVCAKHEKQGEYKNCLVCNKQYYTTKCNQKSKFCTKSCAAKFNNTLRGKLEVKTDSALKSQYNYGKHTKKCIHCSNEFSGCYTAVKKRKYCSFKCSSEHRKQQTWLPKEQLIDNGITKLSENIESNNSIFKQYLIKKFGAKCMKCNWNNVNIYTGRVPIELEHKDGDCTNNNLSNLELLCPNCHSLTATYKGANRREGGSKRYHMWKEYFK